MENLSFESIDIIDSLCSNIRVDLRGTEVVRILPRKNDTINEDWITDTARYAFDGLRNQRMGLPLFYQPITWSFRLSGWSYFYAALAHFYVKYLSIRPVMHYVDINIGSALDLFSSYIIFMFSKMIPSCIISLGHYSKQKCQMTTQSFVSNKFFDELENADYLVFNNISFSSKYPLIKTRLRRIMESEIESSSFGVSRDSIFNRISLLSYNHVLLFRGKLFSSYSLINKRCVVSCSPYNELLEISYINKHKLLGDTCIMHTRLKSNDLSSLHGSYLGEVYETYELAEIPATLFYGIDSAISLDLSKHDDDYFYIFQGTHKNINHLFNQFTQYNQRVWYLPTSSHFEEDMPYLNILGILQWTKKITDSFNFSQSNSSILTNVMISLYNAGIFDTIAISDIGTSLSRNFLDKIPSLLTSRCIEQSYSHIEHCGAGVNTCNHDNMSGPLFVQYSSVINQVKRAKERYFSQYNVFV